MVVILNISASSNNNLFYSANAIIDLSWEINTLENDLYQTIQRTVPDFYKGLTKDQLWKLVFMERKDIPGGKEAYENEEPGYLRGLYKGYQFMLETLSNPLTPELYEKMHDAAVDGLKTRAEILGVPKGFRDFNDGVEEFNVIPNETLSEDGFQELMERYNNYYYNDPETGEVYYFLKKAMKCPKKTIDSLGQKRSYLCLKPTRPETAKANVAACIQFFQERQKNTLHERLSAIARLCQDLNQLHVFVDGNIRTTGILLLNRLLIQNGLSPSVLKDVNILDCLSENEIVDCIKEGQDFFNQVCS